MKAINDIVADLIQDYEHAFLVHAETVRKHEATAGSGDEAAFNRTKESMLHAGSTASNASGRLNGFILGLLVCATARQQHPEA